MEECQQGNFLGRAILTQGLSRPACVNRAIRRGVKAGSVLLDNPWRHP